MKGVNKDIHGKLRWEFVPMQALEFETGYSRPGQPYAGIMQNTNTSTLVKSMYGKETNRIYRQTYGLTWTGRLGQRRHQQQLCAV